jgi:hypothetical protein
MADFPQTQESVALELLRIVLKVDSYNYQNEITILEAYKHCLEAVRSVPPQNPFPPNLLSNLPSGGLFAPPSGGLFAPPSGGPFAPPSGGLFGNPPTATGQSGDPKL